VYIWLDADILIFLFSITPKKTPMANTYTQIYKSAFFGAYEPMIKYTFGGVSVGVVYGIGK